MIVTVADALYAGRVNEIIGVALQNLRKHDYVFEGKAEDRIVTKVLKAPPMADALDTVQAAIMSEMVAHPYFGPGSRRGAMGMCAL